MLPIMQTLDSTIANVALPHTAGSLSASQDQIARVPTSSIVAAAIATPLTGWLSTRARFVAYLNDFRMMMVATLIALPFLLPMRRQRPASR